MMDFLCSYRQTQKKSISRSNQIIWIVQEKDSKKIDSNSFILFLLSTTSNTMVLTSLSSPATIHNLVGSQAGHIVNSHIVLVDIELKNDVRLRAIKLYSQSNSMTLFLFLSLYVQFTSSFSWLRLLTQCSNVKEAWSPFSSVSSMRRMPKGWGKSVLYWESYSRGWSVSRSRKYAVDF